MKSRIGIAEVRSLMQRYLEQDSGKQSLDSEGDSLEDALRNAAIQLGVPVARLEYVVVAEGSSGIAGIGRKKWQLKVSETVQKEEAGVFSAAEEDFSQAQTEQVQVDKDGEALVRLGEEGAMLKVTAPIGHGKRAGERQATERLHARAVRDFDAGLVSQVVRDASGVWVKVGDFIHNPNSDAILSCEVGDGEMRASIVVMPPGPGGCDITGPHIYGALRNARVSYGIKEDLIADFEDHPVYKQPYTVAEGEKPLNGKDAYVKYLFDVEQSKVKLREGSSGKVNFKELNLIQNVVANQPLGRKVQAEKGVPGRTVNGKILPAKNGKDIPMPLGKNVKVDQDGLTIVSVINGQVIMVGGKINVEEVYTVQGDVNLRTGNIMFLGTVLVTGNVEDGFSVKASGNIEISGSIGRCELDAEGDIIVHQGIAAKSGGRVHSGKSVWARFIENAQIEAEEYVVVSDGIINSQVSSNKKIICQGKRASIVGGHLRACEEINAKALGSAVSGTETILEVGYDPRSKNKLDKLAGQAEQIRRQVDDIDKNLITLQNLKKQKKSLSEEKEAFLQEQLGRREDLAREMSEIGKEIESINNYLSSLKVKGKVSASGKIYPGVKINIREQSYVVKNEQKGITFFLENGLIRSTKYEAIEDVDIKKGPPDAYKAD